MNKALFLLFSCFCNISGVVFATNLNDASAAHKTIIVGGGIVGALESYYAYKDAKEKGETAVVAVYEKGHSFDSDENAASTNTSYNIVPSLTPDEILSVVPRGTELVKKLAILFSQPGGIRVDDVPGVNEQESGMRFKEAVSCYGSDLNHDDRTLALLMMGKKSMSLWRQMYDEADDELKDIFDSSFFNACYERDPQASKVLKDGYRIDLIYGIPDAEAHALSMKADYEKLGYLNCAILSPDEVVTIDPFLTDFCEEHSNIGSNGIRIWKGDSVAMWRPGGCIEMNSFLPKFYGYLKKAMGQYVDVDNQVKDCFQLYFDSEAVGIILDQASEESRVIGLQLEGEKLVVASDADYVFCPGESVGTLKSFGFDEPAYAGFAGASLMLNIPLSQDQCKAYQNLSHCMEVHNEGIVLAWQARFKEDRIFIGAAGTKAFYADVQPDVNQEFARNRNLVQLNMINQVLPEFLSLALGYDTKGKTLTSGDLYYLEDQGIAKRWVGRRAVAYDGFPTLGSLYCNQRKVANARCTTHLGSGGVSFGPAAVYISRLANQPTNDALVYKILHYADSTRTPQPL